MEFSEAVSAEAVSRAGYSGRPARTRPQMGLLRATVPTSLRAPKRCANAESSASMLRQQVTYERHLPLLRAVQQGSASSSSLRVFPNNLIHERLPAVQI